MSFAMLIMYWAEKRSSDLLKKRFPEHIFLKKMTVHMRHFKLLNNSSFIYSEPTLRRM